MKSIISLLVFFCFTLFSSGQIKFNSSLEVGYENRKLGFYDPEYTDYRFFPEFKNNMYTTLELTSEFKNFKIYTSNKTYFVPVSIIEYDPKLAEYLLGVEYTRHKFIIGYEHMCSHSLDRKYFTESYDRFFLNFKLFNELDPEEEIQSKIIKFNGSLEAGYEDKTFGFNNPEYLDHYFIAELKNNIYGAVELNSKFKGFNIYGNNKTYLSPHTLLSYTLIFTEFRFGAKYIYKRFVFGYEYFSSHSLNNIELTDKYHRIGVNFKFFKN